jgi:hypothetical protein
MLRRFPRKGVSAQERMTLGNRLRDPIARAPLVQLRSRDFGCESESGVFITSDLNMELTAASLKHAAIRILMRVETNHPTELDGFDLRLDCLPEALPVQSNVRKVIRSMPTIDHRNR